MRTIPALLVHDIHAIVLKYVDGLTDMIVLNVNVQIVLLLRINPALMKYIELGLRVQSIFSK